jgi:hypothetical protein
VPKLSTNFEETLSHNDGDLEEKNKIVEPSIIIINHCNIINTEGKAIQLQGLTGPEGSKRLRLPDFKTIGT